MTKPTSTTQTVMDAESNALNPAMTRWLVRQNAAMTTKLIANPTS
ncbi:hypothetical protein ABQE92_06670 [Mycolicibacterium thermoresistibile]